MNERRCCWHGCSPGGDRTEPAAAAFRRARSRSASAAVSGAAADQRPWGTHGPGDRNPRRRAQARGQAPASPLRDGRDRAEGCPPQGNPHTLAVLRMYQAISDGVRQRQQLLGLEQLQYLAAAGLLPLAQPQRRHPQARPPSWELEPSPGRSSSNGAP